MTAVPLVARGRLHTYLGIAPGVGKTYAMLQDGRARRRAGIDVVVAYWERHGRSATTAQLGDLEVLPTRSVSYRNSTFEELDVNAVLERRPELTLVDELAHANLPGERHAKRWQDVDELLANGIDVSTTLNVANIESLGQLVADITGVHPAEPVPDAFVRGGEVTLVDLAPSALRHRLARGLIGPIAWADAALANYYRFANLAALQELVHLWLDLEEVADAAHAFKIEHGPSARREPTVIVVGLDGSPADLWLIRYAADLAELSNASLHGIHVSTGARLDRQSRSQLENDRHLLEELHGSLRTMKADDAASGLVQAARDVTASQLVIGSSGRSRWSRLLTGSTVGQVLRTVGDLSVQVVNVGRPNSGRPNSIVHRPRHEGGGVSSQR